MKKLIISLTALVLISIWAVKFYSLNNGFKVHESNPIKYYSMHEKVSLDNNASFSRNDNTGYSVSLDDARIVYTDDLLAELNDQSNFSELPEKLLVLTFTVFNDGDNENGMSLFSLPVMGLNWHTRYHPEITDCLNRDINENITQSDCISVPKGENIKVSVAYQLYRTDFSPKQWNAIEKLDMCVWVTFQPLDQRIKIEF